MAGYGAIRFALPSLHLTGLLCSVRGPAPCQHLSPLWPAGLELHPCMQDLSMVLDLATYLSLFCTASINGLTLREGSPPGVCSADAKDLFAAGDSSAR